MTAWRLVHRAGQDRGGRGRAPDGGAGVVERREHGGREAGRLEGGVEGDGGLEVVHRDEGCGRPWGNISGRPCCRIPCPPFDT